MNSIVSYLYMFICKLMPLQKEVVFRSFNGHYSDSPKAISEQLHKLRPDIRIVWLVEESRLSDLPSYVKGVDINSKQAIYHMNTASVFIDNNYGKKGIIITSDNKRILLARVLSWLSTRRHQLNITTWHGTPLKKIGNDVPDSNGIDLITPPLTMIHPNRHTKEVLDRITFNKVDHLTLGLPRNDILFQKDSKKLIKSVLGLPENKKVVLYAPTFRSDGHDTDGKNVERSGLSQLKSIDFDSLFKKLSAKFGGDEWVFVGRFHYFVEKEISWEKLEQKYPGKIINGNIVDDMSLYLTAADVLISDCSSCMFDYAFTKRPVFLFFPDIDHYQGVERGFYFRIEDLPFPCSKTFDGLLKDVEEFDNESFINSLDKMNNDLGAVDDGLASKRVVDFFLSKSQYLNK